MSAGLGARRGKFYLVFGGFNVSTEVEEWARRRAGRCLLSSSRCK